MKTRLSPALAAFLGFSFAASADVKLPALISDNMVLMQDSKANVWGTADPGEKVTAKLTVAGFKAIEHRLSFSRQAFVFRAIKPGA